MKKWLKGLLLLPFVLILMVFAQYLYNEYQLNKVDRLYESKQLEETDLSTLQEVNRLKQNFGSQIWPGFKDENIPVILFNDRYEFLTLTDDIPDGWIRTGQKLTDGRYCYRRKAEKPVAFAVQTDSLWAASMSTLQYLNRDILVNLRKEIPSPLNLLMPAQMIIRTSDYHVAAIIHEMFHAFQALHNPQQFNRCNASSHLADQYPYRDNQLNKLFTREGHFLQKALKADHMARKREWCRKFLITREKRRKMLSGEIVEFEKHFEWLEGLAKYAEIHSYQLALQHEEDMKLSYDEDLPYWETEMDKLNQLGQVHGSTRFYLSGMAQARLLSQVSDQWRHQLMINERYTEDLLDHWAGNTRENR